MCDRHKDYQPRFIHSDVDCFRKERKEYEHHPLDERKMYLQPYEEQEKVNNKVQNKIDQLNKKRGEHSNIITHQKIKCENVTDDEYWSMVDVVESDDLYCVQLHETVRTLEQYIRWNTYFEGRKNYYALGFDVFQKIRCKCRHSMTSHNGEYNESFCGMGCDCKKMILSEKNDLLLRRLSGTLPTLDGRPMKPIEEVEIAIEETPNLPKQETPQKKVTLEEFT